jgi:hypothetical protein
MPGSPCAIHSAREWPIPPPMAIPPVNPSASQKLSDPQAGPTRGRLSGVTAMGASRFQHRAAPPELTVTYRGPLGPIEVDAEGDWIRDVLAGLPPHSRKARRPRRLLQTSEAHWERVWADREASGFAAAHAHYEALEGDLRATAAAALDDEDALAQTIALLAFAAGGGSRCEIMSRAPRLILALLD